MKHSKTAFLAAALLSAQLGATAYGQAATGDTTANPPGTTMDTTRSPTSTPSTSTDTTRSSMDRSTTTTDSSRMNMDNDSATARLPSTATPMWLLGIVNGLWVAGLAFALRLVRRPL
jgi:hypothetical protein